MRSPNCCEGDSSSSSSIHPHLIDSLSPTHNYVTCFCTSLVIRRASLFSRRAREGRCEKCENKRNDFLIKRLSWLVAPERATKLRSSSFMLFIKLLSQVLSSNSLTLLNLFAALQCSAVFSLLLDTRQREREGREGRLEIMSKLVLQRDEKRRN